MTLKSARNKTVIQPYLKNKKDKTFLDHYLLGHDLSEFLKPWNHARLNVVERILLAQRVDGERAATARHVKELFELLPPNIERANMLFRTAIATSALDADKSITVALDELKADAPMTMQRAKPWPWRDKWPKPPTRRK